MKCNDDLQFSKFVYIRIFLFQLRVWFHVKAIVQNIMPLRGSVIRYLCKLTDKELRLSDRRLMADTMWTTVKSPPQYSLIFDRDSMDLAFRYFTSSTLTVRLTGLNQITNQVHAFFEIFHNDTQVSVDVDELCGKLASWLVEINIVDHLFGPNLHVELLKQSQVILNFLAQEAKITNQHLQCIWAAAQLKHASRYVHDLLTTLAKHLDTELIQYLLGLVSSLPVASHNKQTLYLALVLIRIVWNNALSSHHHHQHSQGVIARRNSPASSTAVVGANTAAAVAASLHSNLIQPNNSSIGSPSSTSTISDVSLDTALPGRSDSQEEIPEAVKREYTGSTIAYSQDQTMKEVSGSSSSDDSITCSDRAVLEDFDDEELGYKHHEEVTCVTEERKKVNFRLEDVCVEGNTLLWDIVQDKNACQLEDGLLQEAEKLLCQLICYVGEKKIRFQFVKGCLDNLAQHKSVVLSLGLLPKLFCSFQPFTGANTYEVVEWANKKLNMMKLYFENLVQYCQQREIGGRANESFFNHYEEVQARLQFLTSVYSTELSPQKFRLTSHQVDLLWSCLVEDDECSDDTLDWFVNQARNKDFHALDVLTFKYIFKNKMSALKSQTVSMTGLSLFQQLFSLFLNEERSGDSKIPGMDQLWSIALIAQSGEVSQAAITFLNSFYIHDEKGSLRREREFIQRCMDSLKNASATFNENLAVSLQMMERALTLLKEHLKLFKQRFAYHLKLRALEGQGIHPHQFKIRNNEKIYPIRVVCQPAGRTEKGTFRMFSTDLVAELRAEVTCWCKKLQEKHDQIKQDQDAAKMGPPVFLSPGSSFSPFSGLTPPFRLISQGHELTPELDEKSLGEVGFKDLQLVFVSVGAGRRDCSNDSNLCGSSLLPTPNQESIPLIIMQEEPNFTQLFDLIQLLRNFISKERKTSEIVQLKSFSKLDSEEIKTEHYEKATLNPQVIYDDSATLSKVQHLSHMVWDLLMFLPTNFSIRNNLETFGHSEDSESEQVNWRLLLDPSCPHKLLYALEIVHSIAKRSFEEELTKDSEKSDLSSDSDISDMDDDSEEKAPPVPQKKTKQELEVERSHLWSRRFVESGGLGHLLDIFLSGCLLMQDNPSWTQSHQECLASLLNLVKKFGTLKLSDEGMHDEEEVFVVTFGSPGHSRMSTAYKEFRLRNKSTDKDDVVEVDCLSKNTIELIDKKKCLEALMTTLYESTVTSHRDPVKPNPVRAEVLYHAVQFLVSWTHTDNSVFNSLVNHPKLKPWLQRLVLLAPEHSVRYEASRGLFNLCLIKEASNVNMLLEALLNFLPLARKMKCVKIPGTRTVGPSCREYFILLLRLVDTLPSKRTEKEVLQTSLDSLASYLAESIISHESLEKGRNSFEDETLSGMLKLCAAVVRQNPSFNYSEKSLVFMKDLFQQCLFDLPKDSSDIHVVPKCRSKSSRLAAFDLLLELSRESEKNFTELQNLLLKHHSSESVSGHHVSYGWHYWPHDNCRSSCGLAGMINLGATCYMASCMQQLYMMPEARASILKVQPTGNKKLDTSLKEMQKMFCFLMESERKAYNPRSFCKTYIMDKKPLNTGEQKDMNEFFTDLITKLEDMSPDMRELVRDLFCGETSNNVVSLDCSHVSQTKEEFFSVRCTVADMKDLYESLNEVTIKDTLEGDNMYTCSQCGTKVRAEKRACFKVLPRILCFNTMRYTFNMVTMMKEKVNTHFSFPRQLNMAPYTEEYLMGEKKDQDPEKDLNYIYNLIGVVVHTGTAEGGHYYSFIRDRTSGQNDRWFLFNDAEVKPFDPQQIASECFGGEMMTKTYDAVTEKFLDFSFEKTHSAYMLFYEREERSRNTETGSSASEMDPELLSWIWKDNIQFIRDKQIFDLTYFNTMWLLCSKVAPTFTESSQTSLSNVKLATSFLLETFIHSKEKPGLKAWSDLLVVHFDNSREACQWFLDHMAEDSWWLQQILLRCPVQATRQVFARLCLHVIQILRPSQVALYCSSQKDVENGGQKPAASCSVTNFVQTILKLLSTNVKNHMRNMTELFSFLHQFCQLGSEERRYLLSVNTITTLVNFFFKLKSNEPIEVTEDDDVDDDDDDVVPIFPEEKFRPFALEKMVTVIAFLVEEAKGQSKEVQLSESDNEALLGGQGYPFIFEIVKDVVNLKHTGNLVFTLCMHNQDRAEKIVSTLMSSVKRLSSEQTQPFFKLLNTLTELSLGTPGPFSFTNLILARIWEAAEYNACVCLEWLQNVVSKNKMARQFVLSHMDTWVEPFLVADNSMRIRNDSAYLLVALIPNNPFKQGFRTKTFVTPLKDVQLSPEAQTVLHKVYGTLLKLMPKLKTYCDRTLHGTTKLTSYFTVLNYCLISNKEKEMFTSHSIDIWKMFHPLMSEPNISVFPNKQALLTFWYHVCNGCEKNVAFITDTSQVVENIPFNYILSNDDPEVIAFNRSVLPVYYGLLRLACEHSAQFTRELAKHANMTWAFEYLTSRINQYPKAVDELFNLMNLFSGNGQNLTKSSEVSAAAAFRTRTIKMYMTSLDCGTYWTTLIYALKILLQTEEDKLTVALNNGLMSLADAFTTLHLMYHEATACHVTGDLTDVLSVMLNIFNCCRAHMNRQDVKSGIYGWAERIDMAQKLLSLLNFYTPKEIRKCCLEVLHTIILIYQDDCVNSLVPIIYQSHRSRKENPDSIPLGPFFPRRYGKGSINSKSSRQMAVPEINMALHRSYIDCSKGVDANYDKELTDYFLPYHQFVDKLVRCGLTNDKVNENVIKLSCLMAMEGLPLHFILFTKIWSEIYNKSHEIPKYKAWLKELCQQNEFIEYVDLILFEERTIINVNPTYSFLCSIFPRISSRVAHEQWNSLVNTLVSSIIADQNQADALKDSELNDLARRLTADLRVLSLLFTASAPQKADVSEMLVPSLKRLLGVCRRHQKTKQDKRNEQKDAEKTEGTKVDEKKSEKDGSNNENYKDEGEKNEKHSGDDDSSRPPPSKRRRSEDVATSSETGEPSMCPAQSEEKKEETGESSKGRRIVQATKASGQLIRKIHSDWVDSLAKIIESVMSKVPK
ncbi:Ubiquitin carboxyl-terminal hydrolase 34 [Paramuricea clavata]|uniref:ubiquitinyl hydrolase 1 n=1 Tax=Paramuricea clavata TaxID=317549 RepID=A0A7D9HFH6_PARCT|nr:Ubiquitin carboxyl-terminal hydrolase 34 [Paramuricea clavata]